VNVVTAELEVKNNVVEFCKDGHGVFLINGISRKTFKKITAGFRSSGMLRGNLSVHSCWDQ
jgi:hypothetical protein